MSSKIYVLPISGNRFAVQLGILSAISMGYDFAFALNQGNSVRLRSNEKPTIVLGSSGGNLVGYTGLAADWNSERLYDLAAHFQSDTFLTQWLEYAPGWLFLPFSQSMYRSGYGFEDFFNRVFPEGLLNSPASPEMWTGTFERGLESQRLFTNRSQGSTQLTPRSSPMSGSLEIGVLRAVPEDYLAGNRKSIAQISLASASIPWIVRPVSFGKSKLSDGGSIFASPLITMVDEIAALPSSPIRAFYFSSLPISISRTDAAISPNMLSDIDNFVYGVQMVDIRLFISLVEKLGISSSPAIYSSITASTLGSIIVDADATNQNYGVLIAPAIYYGDPFGLSGISSSGGGNTAIPSVDITKLRFSDIRAVMRSVESNLTVYVWK